jgi:peptidoglycan-N-acetylglucosamine deacetylase
MKKKAKLSRNKILLFIALFILLILFILYSLWWPSSQIFYKTTYKNSNNHVSLTFDDGPGPETSLIFETLVKNNVTATFFVVCNHMSPSEYSLVKNMSDNGMEIGLHGMNHVKFEGYNSLNECKNMLENITGKPVLYYRPPYGFKAPNTMRAARELNMTIVLWSVFPRDYNAKNSDVIISRIERRLKSDSIVCMHDGPENRVRTVQALQTIITYAKEKGFVSEKLTWTN